MTRTLKLTVFAFVCASFALTAHAAHAFTGAVNRTYAFQATATDPEGDPIYYNFNWGDGSPETRSPASGTVASGTQVSGAHSWGAAGVYSVYAVACDASLCSLQSDPQTADIQLPSKPGPITSDEIPPTTSQDGTFTLTWAASDPHSLISVPVSISQYDVWRQFNGGSFMLQGSVTSNDYTENNIPDGSYVYYVIAKDDTTPPNVSPQSDSFSITVSRPAGGTPPTANFDFCALSSDTIQFQDLSTDSDGTVTAWSWDFGDGNSSTQQHPFHAFSGGGGGGADPWWNANWTKRRKITFDNSAQPENLANFPVLITLQSPARIDYAQTQNSGEDIRFVDAGGSVLLAHEIEKWNESGNSYVWVRVPEIASASTTDHIWMYYGNPTPSPTPAPPPATSVWSNGYAGVWHLKETSGQHADASGNGNNAAATVTVQGTATGKINGGDELNGANDALQINQSASINNLNSLTLEGWFFAESWGGADTGRFLQKNSSFTFRAFSNSNKIIFSASRWSTAQGDWEAANTFSTGSWHYLALNYNYSSPSNDPVLYVNGTTRTMTETTAPQGSTQSDTANLHIGNNSSLNRGFDGLIDETRISSTVRSAHWISAQYKSMTDAFFNNAQSFAEETYSSGGGPSPVTLIATDNDLLSSSPYQQLVDPASAPACASRLKLATVQADLCNRIGLVWTNSGVPVADYHTVRRTCNDANCLTFNSWGLPVSAGITTAWYDTTVSPNTTYQYYLKAILPAAGELHNSTDSPSCTGGWSGAPPAQICPYPVTPPLTSATPACAPSVPPLLPNSGCGSIALAWNASPGAVSYRVWRTIGSDNFAAAQAAGPIASVPNTQLTYTDTNIVPDVVYYYYVSDEKNPPTPSTGVFPKSACFRGSRWQER